MPQKKKPKYICNPPTTKKPTFSENVDSIESMRFKWHTSIKYIDYADDEWGWHEVPVKKFFDKCLDFLQSYEDKTWAQMKEGSHCHPVRLKDIIPKARKIITNRFGDIDDLYQVKAQGKCRLFGRKDKQIFYLVWHDEHHQVYPMGE